jgi:hypothetical protein
MVEGRGIATHVLRACYPNIKDGHEIPKISEAGKFEARKTLESCG